MDEGLKERILLYIESVKPRDLSEEKTWWQHPEPVYHDTKEYAANYDRSIDIEEPVVFKKVRKEGLIASVMIIVAAVLLYLLSKKHFGFIELILLSLLLLVVLPRLLENKAMIRISRDSIWIYKENKEIPWEHVVLTCIKEAREEQVTYFFVNHYYDKDNDHFNKTEIELTGVTEPAVLSATIEAFREAGKLVV
jgi:hypothetical protein